MLLPLRPPAANQRSRLSALAGSADALALAEFTAAHRPLVVITATALDGQRLLDEMRWFSPGLDVHLLPDWETLPYDSFSPHHDLVSERLETLYLMMQNACDAVIVPVTTALLRLPPREFLALTPSSWPRGTGSTPTASAASSPWPATPTSRRWWRRANTAIAAG